MNIDIPKAPDEWALNICKKIPGVNEYWNLEGGKKFFDIEKYQKENIRVFFIKMDAIIYQQKRSTFERNLSVIDVMMFNSIEEILKLMDEFSFI